MMGDVMTDNRPTDAELLAEWEIAENADPPDAHLLIAKGNALAERLRAAQSGDVAGGPQHSTDDAVPHAPPSHGVAESAEVPPAAPSAPPSAETLAQHCCALPWQMCSCGLDCDPALTIAEGRLAWARHALEASSATKEGP